MPYISRERRVLMAAGAPPLSTGELTFAVQQLIKRYLDQQQLRYQAIVEVSGVLHQTQRDFDERVVVPYEKKKRQENGDVWWT